MTLGLYLESTGSKCHTIRSVHQPTVSALLLISRHEAKHACKRMLNRTARTRGRTIALCRVHSTRHGSHQGWDHRSTGCTSHSTARIRGGIIALCRVHITQHGSHQGCGHRSYRVHSTRHGTARTRGGTIALQGAQHTARLAPGVGPSHCTGCTAHSTARTQLVLVSRREKAVSIKLSTRNIASPQKRFPSEPRQEMELGITL